MKKIIKNERERAIECILAIIDGDSEKTESPIEEALFWALHGTLTAWFPGVAVAIIPQKRIGKYRADFLVDVPGIVKIVVEADGHDFHEKTKYQAQRDRKRDRDIQSYGYKVMRFTGSEIYANPRKCAWEVERMIVVECLDKKDGTKNA